jgi:hypothetical protein
VSDSEQDRRHIPDLTASKPQPTTTFTREDARIRTFEILGEPNRIERMRRLCELLATVDGANWRDVINGFTRQISTSGISRREEWRLIMARIAAVAGQAAIDEALQGGKQEQERVPLLLTGWAADDPKAAVSWLEAQPKEMQAALANSLINGLAEGNPQEAIAFLAAHPEITNLASQMIDGLSQGGGLVAGDQLLAAVRGRSEISDQTKGSIFFNIAMRRLELAHQSEQRASFLDWADRYIGPEFMGPMAAKHIVTFAAESDATAALRWVEERSGRWTQQHESVIYPVLAHAMQAQSPEQFEAWIGARRDHPHHGPMLEAAATALLQRGDAEGAMRMVNLAVTADARTRIEQLVQKAQAAGTGK